MIYFVWKLEWCHFAPYYLHLLHKKPHFDIQKIENHFFVKVSWKLPLALLFGMAMCTYVTNMGTLSWTMVCDMALTLVISLESHVCSYMITHFVKSFFSKVVKIQVYHFSWQLIHIKGLHDKWFHFWIFLHFLWFFSKRGQNRRHVFP